MNRFLTYCLVALTTAIAGCNAILGNDSRDLAPGEIGTPSTGPVQDGGARGDSNLPLASPDGTAPQHDGGSQRDATSERGAVTTFDGGAEGNAPGVSADSTTDGQLTTDATASETGTVTSGMDATTVMDAKVVADAQPLPGQGSSCSSTMPCAAGLSCADGVCCDRPCTGSCEQCNLPSLKGTCSSVPQGQAGPTTHTACSTTSASTCQTNGKCDGNGKCELWSNGTSCGAGSCTAATNMATTGLACDGAGMCKPKSSTTCAPFKCAAGGATCALTCATNADCVGLPCVNGSCGTVANGSACTSSSQCTTNNCIDGYCCDSGCSGSCQACDVAGHEGACMTVPSGPPHGSRSCAGTGTCKGSCGGSASCIYPTGTCSSQSCSNGVETLAASCDGAGACSSAATSSCLGFACNGASCYTSCTGDRECGPSTPFCNAGACQSLAPLGHGCTSNGECAMGFCIDSVCCGTSSCPAADTCHNASTCGAGGACSTRTVKTGGVCNDNDMCTQNDSCQSDGSCVGTPITCTTDSCHVVGACVKATGCPTPTPKVVHSLTPVTFLTTGAPISWTVPDCVTQINVDAAGAQGGQGELERQVGPEPGGMGGQVIATLIVTPGSTLQINVGGVGSDAGGTTAGANGGGACAGITGGCGGGSSDIRVSPYRATAGADDRILVAGGGGGGALAEQGGAGGGTVGGAGCFPADCGVGNGEGMGGSQSAGGAAGVNTQFITAVTIGNGDIFLGGTGGQCIDPAQLTPVNWGGGGGGGYYGGGGGCEAGGGGGSSFVRGGTNVSYAQGIRSGSGYVNITW